MCCSTGLKAIIDLGQPIDKRVQSVYARCGNCVVPVYKELDLNGNYTVIMSDYLADGGDGHNFKKMDEFRDIGKYPLVIGNGTPIVSGFQYFATILYFYLFIFSFAKRPFQRF